MILDFILHGLYLIVSFLLSPLTTAADATTPPLIASAISTASAFINAVSVAAPVETFYAVLASLLAFELIIFGTKGIIFGIKKIPFIG